MKKLFTLSYKATNATGLIIALLVYLLAPGVCTFIINLLPTIIILSAILNIILWLFGIYCLVGLILAILVFAKVVK